MKEIIMKGLEEKIYEAKTKEGLKVYIWPKENVKGTYLTLSVNFGSIHTEFKVGNKTYKMPNGVAHFLEHVKFNIAKDTTAHELIQKLGGEANAFTTFKFTSYTLYTAQNVKDNLNTLLDYVYTPYFTKQLINKEKGIIIEEAKMNLDDPYSVSYFAFYRQLFHKIKYRYEITGTPDEIKKITVQDVENAYRYFYHPENMFLVVTGNVNPYEIIKIVEENLNAKSFGKFVKPEIMKVKEDKKVVLAHQDLALNISTPELKMAFKIPRNKFKNVSDRELMIYLNLLLNINFGTTSAFREMLRTKELMASFASRVSLVEDYIIIYFNAVTDYASEIEKHVLKQMDNLILTEAEFDRKRKVEIATLILQYDNVLNVNEAIQADLVHYGKITDNIKEILEKLDYKKFQEIARGITLDNKATMVLVPQIKE